MEQKQLDELDETPLEEYIEEEDEVEDFKAKKKAIKKPKKSPWKDEQIESPLYQETTKEEPETNVAEEAHHHNSNKSHDTPDPNEHHCDYKTKEKSTIKHVSFEAKEPINPWASDNEPKKESSTWKIMCLFLVLLLIIAIITSGFHIFKGSSDITKTEAEQRVLAYVNEQLQVEHVTAAVVSSKDMGQEYLITLKAAGQTIDTYISKDGKLFFPQGFDLTKISQGAGTVSEQNSNLSTNQPADPNNQPSSNNQPPSGSQRVPPSTKTPPVATPPSTLTGHVIDINLAAKRWVFTPTQLTATAGDHIKLHLNPQSIAFTFAIPELGVEKEISTSTIIEFDVPTSTNYTYICKSCEDYRGMSGTLVVK